jgi:hypothetical protein
MENQCCFLKLNKLESNAVFLNSAQTLIRAVNAVHTNGNGQSAAGTPDRESHQ